MRILTRYLLRSHLGPFLFALTVLTGLIFLNAVAAQVEDLAGKGLPPAVIAEFLLLTLPHVLALTIPMSVLVAVLYTFSDMTAGNEITAISAGGVRPRRIVLPILFMGFGMSTVMYYFNDQLLPETNHRLKNLSVDIAQKVPTFELREQVMNEITSTDGATRVFLSAATIDPETNGMTDVVIFDLSDHARTRTIYADSGTMAFSPDRTDLYLTLQRGEVREVSEARPGQFNRLFFKTQVVPLRNISNVLERSNDVEFRSDREMSISMLFEAAANEVSKAEAVALESLDRSRLTLREALGIPGREGPFDEWDREALAGTDREAAAPPAAESGLSERTVRPAAQERRQLLRPDNLTATVSLEHRTSRTRAGAMVDQQKRLLVEIHKKLAISFACIVFALIGAPLAMRFPRGGVGMVIGVSVGIFSIYWISLIAGERLADRGVVEPFWAMWTPNLVFLTLGIWLTAGIGRRTGSTRGGGWDELFFEISRRLPLGRLRRGTA